MAWIKPADRLTATGMIYFTSSNDVAAGRLHRLTPSAQKGEWNVGFSRNPTFLSSLSRLYLTASGGAELAGEVDRFFDASLCATSIFAGILEFNPAEHYRVRTLYLKTKWRSYGLLSIFRSLDWRLIVIPPS